MHKLLGKVANILYLGLFITYVCTSFYCVWVAVHTTGIASVPRLVTFIEQVSKPMG